MAGAYGDSPTSATGTAEFIDTTTADIYLEEKWSQIVTVEAEENLVFAKLVDRRFEPQLQRGQILHIGGISHLTAQTKSVNTAISYETITETEKSVTINTFVYVAYALEDMTAPLVSVNLIDKYMPEIGYGIAVKQDTDLAAYMDDFSHHVGTLATGLSYNNLVRADQYLNDANAPPGDRCIVISPAERANFLTMDQFVHRDYSALYNGLIGSWLGQYPIYVSTNVEGDNTSGHDNAMFQRKAIAHIQQIKPSVKTQWDIDYLCVKCVGYTSYGSAEILDDHGVWLEGA